MAMRCTACLLLLLVGCKDEVFIRVNVPEAYRQDVVSINLHVLEPPENEPFTCDDVALDDIRPGIVELSETWLASLDEPGGEYLRLNRRADKRLWVEGVDATGLPMVEGCAELGYVGGDRVINVELEPSVALDLFLELLGLQGEVRDMRGEVVNDATISWRRVEPGGEITTGSATTNFLGRALLPIEPPTRSGPNLTELMVRWSRTGKTLFQGFATPPVLGPVPIGEVVSWAAGRIAPAGAAAGVGVFESCGGTPGEWGTALVEVSPAGELTTEPLHPCIAGSAPVVMAQPSSTDRDRILSIDANGWRTLELDRSGTTLVATEKSGAFSPPLAEPPGALFAVGPCEGADDQFLVADADGNAMGVYQTPSVDGAPATKMLAGPFANTTRIVGGSGCVSDGAGGERRVLLTRSSITDLYGMTIADVAGPGSCRYEWESGNPLATPTVSRSDAVERHLVYAVLKAGVSNIEVQAARLDFSGGGCRPLPVVREPLPALPVAVESGDLDGDGLLDLVAVIGSVTVSDGELHFTERVWASLGVEHEGQRLTGTSVPLEELLVNRLAIYDGDGDQRDDVMMIAAQAGTPVPVFVGVLMGMAPEP